MLGWATYKDDIVTVLEDYYSTSRRVRFYLVMYNYNCVWIKETELTNFRKLGV